MKPFFYDAPILPVGFKFPRDYESTVLTDVLPDIEPWQFLSRDMPTSLYYYGSLISKFPERPLIPFAIINDQSGLYNEGWVVLACFDGTDKTGSPRVLIYDFSTPNKLPWENFSYLSFTDWLKVAQQESARYKRERDEAESDS